MSDIDIKIGQLEKKLSRLQGLAAQIPEVEADLQALRRVRELLNPSDSANGNTPKANDKPTISAAAESVLKASATPLHVDDIRKGIVDMGLDVKPGSLVAALSRYKNRFRSHGKNVFGLVGRDSNPFNLDMRADCGDQKVG